MIGTQIAVFFLIVMSVALVTTSTTPLTGGEWKNPLFVCISYRMFNRIN